MEISPIIEGLRMERHRRRMGQGELAQAIGISQSALSNWERGYASPMLSHMHMWATALGQDIVLVPKDTP